MRARGFVLSTFAGLVLTLFAACTEEPELAPRAERAAEGAAPEQALAELLEAARPLAAGASQSEENAWHARHKATLERLREAGPAVGAAAWRAYREAPPPEVELRIGLLDVAAHNLPAETREHLSELVSRFGPELALRRSAVELLARTSPATAIEVLEPILLRRVRKDTYPPEDKMLAALVEAQRALGQDPTDVLVHVATDLRQTDDARHLAVRELGGTESPRGRAALDQVLVESGLNSYLRRLAAQALQQSLPREEFCARANEVLEREADLGFQIFLASLIESSCR